MKTKAIYFFICFVISLQSFSQKSIQVTKSIGTNNYFEHIFLSGISFFGDPPKHIENVYSINLTYKENSGKRLYTGFNIGYEHLFESSKYENGLTNKTTIKSFKATGELYYQYNAKKRALHFYSFFGVGFENKIISEVINGNLAKSKKIKLAWQLTPIGIDFKLFKNWNGVMEFGFGYKGLINIGLQYNLK